jgi:hypothetical protein
LPKRTTQGIVLPSTPKAFGAKRAHRAQREGAKNGFFYVILVIFVVKKGPVFGACQEYILDTKAPDTRFDQCLQGFRVFKKVVIMTCTIYAVYAIIGRKV